MNHVVERPTSLIKPPLPGKPYLDSRDTAARKSAVGRSFNRKVKLFEGLGHVPEDAENQDELAPLRRRQPKAVTPEQKRWTQIDSTENSSIWISQPEIVSPRIGGSCKQKTLPPTPSPRLLSPASPSRLSPTVAPKEEDESDVKKTPKPKPRARSSIRSGLILDTDISEGTNRTSTTSSYHPPSPVPTPRKSLAFTEGVNQVSPSTYKPPPQVSPSTYKPPPQVSPSTYKAPPQLSPSTYKPPPQLSPSTYKPPPTIPHRRNSKEQHRKSRPVYYTPPPDLHPVRDKDFSGGTDDNSSSSRLQSQPPSVPNHRNVKNINEKLNNQTSRSGRQSETLPNRKQLPDSVFLVNDHSMANFNRKPRKPRALTQFENVTYDAYITGNNDKDAQRPRAHTEQLPGGRALVDDDDDKRMSVLELAQSFGQLNHFKKDSYSERPKTYGYPVRNGHANKIAKSNPDLLNDDSEESTQVGSGGYGGTIARSNPDLLSDDPEDSSDHNGGHLGRVANSNPDLLSDDCDEQKKSKSKSKPFHEEPRYYYKLERRRSKSLSDFNLIDMPPMDPAKYTHGGKVKQTQSVVPPPRPQTGPMRPVSMMPGAGPTKPKRTYEHDAYVLRKSMKGLPKTGGHMGATHTKSAAPAFGRPVSALAIHPAINAKKKHLYDDVYLERHGEEEDNEKAAEEEEGEKQTKEYLPISPTSPHWKSLPPETNARPVSSMSAVNKSPNPRRGKLQRSARIERWHSHDDLLADDKKISGEYANPEIAIMSKNNKEKSRRKPEYSEPYLHRSSSEDSLHDKRKTHPPVEDSAGYTVPGSHLWLPPEDKEEAKRRSQVKFALHNIVSI